MATGCRILLSYYSRYSIVRCFLSLVYLLCAPSIYTPLIRPSYEYLGRQTYKLRTSSYYNFPQQPSATSSLQD